MATTKCLLETVLKIINHVEDHAFTTVSSKTLAWSKWHYLYRHLLLARPTSEPEFRNISYCEKAIKYVNLEIRWAEEKQEF